MRLRDAVILLVLAAVICAVFVLWFASMTITVTRTYTYPTPCVEQCDAE